ncbi:hypothetical protein [Streptomyces sp. DSM 40907]|uniref:hypothetical protein n=1 Tax=Streptomyces kutzneri TaxID=3051179 RepID=UPI0028D43893|nr:hypothetical protein [Streptomyces sp. DSM 40907]
MNSFLACYRDTLWVNRDVSIRDTDLTFYVGSRPWDQGLGAEAKVLFFLAYSYATLFLNEDLDQECAFPGLLLLDNPYQQGIAADVVRQALIELAEAAALQVRRSSVPRRSSRPAPLRPSAKSPCQGSMPPRR